MPPALLADLILFVHVLYAGFVVLGFVAVPLGAWRGWAWVRLRWLRLAHLVMIALVGVEGVIGMACPLTEWEYDLRLEAGQAAQSGSFIGRILSALLYYDLPAWMFAVAYAVMTLLAVAAWFWIPTRRGT